MKNVGKLFFLCLGLSLVLGFAFHFTAQYDEAVYSIHKRTMKADKDAAALKKLLKETYLPTLNAKIPGLTVFLGESDRGPEEGKWIMIMRFDNKAARDKYFPEAGKATEAWNTAYQNAIKGLPDVNEYFTPDGGAWLGDYFLD